MTDRTALVAAAAADPADPTPRLVLADLLQERGDDARAEFVRAQCELARLPPGEPNRPALAARARELFAAHGRDWLGPVVEALGGTLLPDAPRRPGLLGRLLGRAARTPRSALALPECGADTIVTAADGPVLFAALDRGFVGSVGLDTEHAARLLPPDRAFAAEPIAELTLRLGPHPDWMTRFDSPALGQVRSVGVKAERTADARTLAAFGRLVECPHLTGVRELRGYDVLGRGQRLPAGFVAALAMSPLLARLTALSLTLDPEGLTALAAAPSAAGLRAVYLGMCDLPEEAGAAVAAATFRGAVEDLDLSSNRLGSAGVGLLLAWPWPRLAELDLGYNGLGRDGARAVAAAAAHLPALRVLRLYGNEIDDLGAEALAASPLVPQLTELGLSSSPLTDRGATALADAAEPHPGLTLVLPRNGLSAGCREGLKRQLGGRVRVGDPSVGV